MAEFSPQVYNFVLSPELADSIICWNLEKFQVKKPSFAVLLDHTIAVIWHIFNLDGAELSCLNKADILWSLRFLEAIDTSQIGDTKDLDSLIDYFRKILITRYSAEDEKSFAEDEKTIYESICENYPSSSSALEELLTSFEVQEDKKSATVQFEESKCADADILKWLKKQNPFIQSLDDVKTMSHPPTNP